MTQTPPAGSTRPPGTIRIGSVAGIDVLVSSTWFVIAALIAFVMGPRVDDVEPGLGALKYVVGFVFAVVLYLSVLLHEAAHAIVAQRFGFAVNSITLHFLGGMTEIDSAARRPRQEFWIAVVGPLTSIAVGLASLGAWFLLPAGLVQFAVGGLAAANLLIGVLNLVPGLPLDGGRVLKAIVWGASGNATLGTVVAGWGGRLTAIAVLSWPLVQREVLGVRATLFDYLLVAVLGLFLWTGATAAMVQARLRSRIPLLVARPLARRALAVSGDTPLAEALRRAHEVDAASIVTVSPSGQPTGILSDAALRATPDERRPWVATSAVSRTLEDGLVLPATIAGEELITAMTQRPADEYLLLEEDGSVMGVLTTADVDRAFRETRA